MNFDKIKHKLSVNVNGLIVRFLPGVDNMLFAGENSSHHLCLHIARSGLQRVLVVTDKPLVELGIVEQATRGLAEQGVTTVIFDGVLPDPTFPIITEGLKLLQANNCDAVLAIGGGSSIDSAKIIALAATNPADPKTFVGYGKAKQKPLPLFAIATTSGTGSEATVGAVISDGETHLKSVIADGKLLPRAVALDPLLLKGLPPAITAATGMDALTHAVESYIGLWEHAPSRDYAKIATKLIFQYLPIACENGTDSGAREAMAYAAYCAGIAINRSPTGNVHAIAHQLGARYGVPHGMANACVMPPVLDFSLAAAETRLAELARLVELGSEGESDRQQAQSFITAVRQLNQRIGIPDTLEQIQQQDIPSLAAAAVKESLDFPVPALMSEEDCSRILRQISAA
jgi:alcohol dehydrogenase class IV